MVLRGAANYVKDKLRWPITAVEIGVRSGENARAMLECMDIKQLYLIDHYKPYQDGPVFRSESEQETFYKQMFEAIQPFVDKVVLVSRNSVFAATLFVDGFFDFVYIDSNHNQSEVMADLEAWWPKIAKGGYIGGHDFMHSDYCGVRLAVNSFAKMNNLFVKEMPADDWVLEKI